MHLDQVELSNILPVNFSFSMLEEKLSNNFRIIVGALKSQDAIRLRHESLASQNFHIKEELQQLKGRLMEVQQGLEQKLQKQVLDMGVQSAAIRIEFQTIKPYLEKMKYNTERMDAVEKHARLTANVVKEFDLIRKDMTGMEGRSQLIIQNYKDEHNRKFSMMQQEQQERQQHVRQLQETIKSLKQRLEAMNTAISLGITKPSAEVAPGRPGPTIDDVFKQKVLEKINDINSRLQEVSFQSETNSLRDLLKQIRKMLENKMDMDQYERMLDFMSEEIRRCISIHEQRDHGQTGRSQSVETNSLPVSSRIDVKVPQPPTNRPIKQNTQDVPPMEKVDNNQIEQEKPKLSLMSERSIPAAPTSITPFSPQQGSRGQQQAPDVTEQLEITESLEEYQQEASKKKQVLPTQLSGLKMDKISKDLLPARKRYLNKTPSGTNKAQVDDVKLLQTLSMRIQFLENEVQDLRKTNINMLRNIEQLREPETSITRNQKTESMAGIRPTDKILTSRKDALEPLPNIYKEGKSKPTMEDSIELVQRHRRRNSNSNVVYGSQRQPSQRNNVGAEDKSFFEKNSKDLQKKLTDLRNQVHYYFKELEKSINARDTKEDARKRTDEANDRIEEVRKLIAKKIDSEAVKKNLLFLQNKLNQVIAIMIANEGEAEATMARRGWACLSCDKGMQKFDGKQGQHKAWNLVQGHQSPPRGSGFASMQKSQQRYKNMYMDKTPGDE